MNLRTSLKRRTYKNSQNYEIILFELILILGYLAMKRRMDMGILLIVTVAFLPIFYNMHKRLRILEDKLREYER